MLNIFYLHFFIHLVILIQINLQNFLVLLRLIIYGMLMLIFFIHTEDTILTILLN
jgi:hypothetical protein